MIRVLIVDDSVVVQKVLTRELSKFPDIQVVGVAGDPYIARERIQELSPDVLTLDLEMPRMDGLTFLKKLMVHHPLPVVVVSSLAPENSEVAFRAFECGAVDVVAKPGSSFSVPDVEHTLVAAIRAASVANVRKLVAKAPPVQAAKDQSLGYRASDHVLAIGASTGGPVAVEAVLSQLPRMCPGVVITQHMPKGFTKAFADQLARGSHLDVREALGGEVIAPGTAFVAPAGRHLFVRRDGARYMTALSDAPPEHYQRPAVDVMFRSLATCAGPNATGVLLTGMGADGALGLKDMRDAGAFTIAQDEESCVVFGMPKQAILLGAAERVVPLPDIARLLIVRLTQSESLGRAVAR
ncbi:MAG: chemotaxis response regulator protein-glutamate methylesterase [Polyangiaceae bacterium]|nr:chemotaxis response regulator protein-glutamate methylesterase [Polyangiaceae bacterium]